ncbi:MAG: Hemolysin-type calcium-binding region, partial [Planctomycetaceae bacterium]|nr:Hemolysin-type calcium-binding region [Planctomycetaceae bacterium]
MSVTSWLASLSQFSKSAWPKTDFRRKSSRWADRALRTNHVEALEDRTLLSTFMVTNSNDSGAGSFRQAILDANAHLGKDSIRFDFNSNQVRFYSPGTVAIDIGNGTPQTISTPPQVVVIQPTSKSLPLITEAVSIDGTQSGLGLTGPVPGVEIDGSLLGAGHTGIRFDNGDGSDVSGLIINGFDAGVYMEATDHTTIEDCYFGVALDGSNSAANKVGIQIIKNSGNNDVRDCLVTNSTVQGIYLQDELTTNNVFTGNQIVNNKTGIDLNGSSDNQIGDSIGTLGNLISGNQVGIEIRQAFDGSTAPSQHNLVVNNLIRGNAIGVYLLRASDNTIGGTGALEANTIIQNFEGVVIEAQSSANNVISGNYIGIYKSGKGVDSQGKPTGNGAAGIRIWDASSNTIEENVISGNNPDGFSITLFQDTYSSQYTAAAVVLGPQSNNTLIFGNFIGTNADGTVAIGNTGAGISLLGASSNSIINNVISGGKNAAGFLPNEGDGIIISATSTNNDAVQNVIQANRIGTNLAGTADLGNAGAGIKLQNAQNNTVGGTDSIYQNLISGNDQTGIFLQGPNSKNNHIEGNLIGTNAQGTSAIGNSGPGILVSGASSNSILNNLISGQKNQTGAGTLPGSGILILSSSDTADDTTLNVIQGNRIGTNLAGTADLGNSGTGIFLKNARQNTIGGTDPSDKNLISGNDQPGIFVSGPFSTANQIQGNLIGTNAAGTAALPNVGAGVVIDGAPSNFVGGSDAADSNVISGNQGAGVELQNGATGNHIQGNRIGVDAIGIETIPNTNQGVLISSSSSNLIGGTGTFEGNLIGGNGFDGVAIIGTAAHQGTDATGNMIQGNGIGIVATGASAGNGRDGILVLNARSNTIGGTAAGAGNKIGSNLGNGVNLNSTYSQSNLVQGNSIGGTGTSASHPNGKDGIAIINSSNNTIGNTTASGGNLIEFNSQNGVTIARTTSSNNVITGNTIRENGASGISNSDATGTQIGGNTSLNLQNIIQSNQENGVEVFGGQTTITGNTITANQNGVVISGNNTVIGGTAVGLENVITSNQLFGVAVANGNGNAILSNSISGNGGLGIDLLTGNSNSLTFVGVNINDLNDSDDGGNHFQNYPVLTSVASSGGTITISGSLNTTPNTQVLIQFFSNALPDGSGHGEGQTLLGQKTFTTDSSGNATISASFSGTLNPGISVSATATTQVSGVSKDTSEFSNNVQIPTSETQVNTIAAGPQNSSAIAVDSVGNYVIAWLGVASNGYSTVYYRRFDAAGNPLDAADRVANTDTLGGTSVSIAMDPAGDFVITWSNGDIVARRFNADGNPLDANQFVVNTNFNKFRISPTVAMDSSGDFVIAWTQGYFFGSYGDGDEYGIYARRYNAAGQPQNGQQFQVNVVTQSGQQQPSIAMDPAGDFVIAWATRDTIGNTADVFARRYNAAGTAQGGDIRLNTTVNSVSGYEGPKVAMDAHGNFIATWAGSYFGIYGRRFNSAGTAIDAQPFEIDRIAADQTNSSAVAMDGAGDFIVAWTDQKQTGNTFDQNVVLRRYNANGQAQGNEITVHDFTTNNQNSPAVAMTPGGLNYVATWTSDGQDGSGTGIFARRFGPINLPPSALPQTVSTQQSQSVPLTLSGDDGNSDAVQTLTYAILTPPQYGTLTGFNSATGAVTYTPNPGFGIDTFTFTVTDDANAGGGPLTSNPATVTIKINGAPDLSTSSSIRYVATGPAVVINPALVVTDPDSPTLATGAITITNFVAGEDGLVFANDGSTMGNIAIVSNIGGVLTLGSAGATAALTEWQAALRSVMYSNSNANPTVTPRIVTFSVNDGGASGNLLSSTINVTGSNHAPVLTNSRQLNYREGDGIQSIFPDVTVSDSDNTTLATASVTLTNFVPDEDVLSFVNDNATMGNIAVVSNTDGVLILTSAGATAKLTEWKNALRAVTYSNSSFTPHEQPRYVAFVVNDGLDSSSELSMPLTVQSVNSAPELQINEGPNGTTYTEDHPAIAVISDATVTDDDNMTLASATIAMTNFLADQDVLSFTANPSTMGNIALSSNSNGVLTLVSADNSATFDQWQAALQAVKYFDSSDNPNATFTRTVTITVNDGLINSNFEVVIIQVIGVNDAPVAEDSNLSVTTEVPATATLSATDVDNTQSQLIFQVASPPSHGTVQITDVHTGNYTYTSDTGYQGADSFTFSVNDGSLDSNDGTVTIDVIPSNTPPVFTSNAAISVPENTTSVLTVSATDSDLPQQVITYSITGGADQTLFSITPTGVLTFQTAPSFISPSDADHNNVYLVQITAADGHGGTVAQDLVITVFSTNTPPVFTSNSAITVPENSTAVTTIQATDSDQPQQTVTYFITGGIDQALFSITPAGVLKFQTAPSFISPSDADHNNVYLVQVTADDGHGGTVAQDLVITVFSTNTPPVFTSNSAINVPENSTAVTTIQATDSDQP